MQKLHINVFPDRLPEAWDEPHPDQEALYTLSLELPQTKEPVKVFTHAKLKEEIEAFLAANYTGEEDCYDIDAMVTHIFNKE